MIVIGFFMLILFTYNGFQLVGVTVDGDMMSLVGASDIIPTEISTIYESELGIYDDVSAANSQKADATILVMKNINISLILKGVDLDRYVRILNKMGFKTVMITGDNEVTAKAIAGQVGIGEVLSGVMPEDKLRRVRELQRRGMNAFVGDGVKDALL